MGRGSSGSTVMNIAVYCVIVHCTRPAVKPFLLAIPAVHEPAVVNRLPLTAPSTAVLSGTRTECPKDGRRRTAKTAENSHLPAGTPVAIGPAGAPGVVRHRRTRRPRSHGEARIDPAPDRPRPVVRPPGRPGRHRRDPGARGPARAGDP